MVETVSPNGTITFTSETYNKIQNSTDNLLHEIVSKPDGKQFDFPNATFTINGNEINASVVYAYNSADINLPSAFLEAILLVKGPVTSTTAPTTTTAATTATSTASVNSITKSGTVQVVISLIFQVNTSVANEKDVRQAVTNYLSNQSDTNTLLVNVTYTILPDSSIAIGLVFQITNVTMVETVSPNGTITFTSETYNKIQNSTDNLLHEIVSKPDGKQFDFPNATFTINGDEINASVVYAYNSADINLPSAFLEAILLVKGPVTSTTAPTTTTAATTCDYHIWSHNNNSCSHYNSNNINRGSQNNSCSNNYT
ncbi:hypothetical protein DPEC_G00179030 [Dallia pectoralis]|uniref:Uncharacterized protein n=1 Tax=Dallia pectoralis TaxID=75939 RepID=A0ACC2GFA0_DALPE|nr:hypothetical protein DPEC_G00179030 [Dallia pectoralis]